MNGTSCLDIRLQTKCCANINLSAKTILKGLLEMRGKLQTSIMPLESVAVKDSLSYEDVPLKILECQVRWLSNKEIASVKVLWRSQSVEGATWEAEEAMKAKYPHFFTSDSTTA